MSLSSEGGSAFLWGWRDGLAAKSPCCSWEAPGPVLIPTSGRSLPPVPDAGELTPSSGLSWHQHAQGAGELIHPLAQTQLFFLK